MFTAYDRLADFDVMVASDVIDPTQSSDKQLCAHIVGVFVGGEWIEVQCASLLFGR